MELSAGEHDLASANPTYDDFIVEGVGRESIITGTGKITVTGNLSMRNVAIDISDGIELDPDGDVNEVTLINCWFRDGKYGVKDKGSAVHTIERVRVRGCDFNNMSQVGIQLFGIVEDAVVSDSTFNTIGDGTGTAYGVNFGSNATQTDCKRLRVHSCIFKTINAAHDSEGKGIFLYGEQCEVINNICDTLTATGGTPTEHEMIYTKAITNVIIGNTIIDGSDGGDGWIALKGASTTSCTVTGNVLTGSGGGSGIYISGPAVVDGNRVTINTSSTLIRLFPINDGTESFVVSDNVIVNSGSGRCISTDGDLGQSTITGNTIDAPNATAIKLLNATTYTMIDSLIADNVINYDGAGGSFGIHFDNAGNNNTIQHNVFHGGGTDIQGTY